MKILSLLLCLGGAGPDSALEAEEIQAAARRAVPLLETAAAGTAEHRSCFTCHGQAMPVLAIVEARDRGLGIDQQNLQTQVEHTAEDLAKGKGNYLQGRGQGGGHIRAGYALWTLRAGDYPADETTAAVAGYLLGAAEDGHWRSSSNRPPTEFSSFTATYVALLGLQSYAAEEDAEPLADRRREALDWARRTAAKETEDRVFRLLLLHHLGAEDDLLEQAAADLLERQREDGGWSQLDGADRLSDAYATATALYALHRAGRLAPEETPYRRGVQWLVSHQLEDGSWHVASRSKPFQKYYESGFPHGKDQFISMSATAWAVLALLPAASGGE